jgi:ABC-type microcin C transport system duplicated ATPase subunit YejF
VFARPLVKTALSGVDLTIEHGESLAIIGESGSGKSTLVRLLLALDRPSAGTVAFEGRPVLPGNARSLRWLRRETGIVLQDPYSSLDPRQSVERIVAEPLRSLRIERSRSAVHDRVTAALESVGLPADAAVRYPHEFSGGQRQRIAIARAIVSNPRLLLADEPVSALDVSTRVRIIELLAELGSGANPLTVVVVSHDLGVVAALCERMLVLENGRVVEQGRTDAVLAAPQHPYTRRLLASVPRLPA